MTHLVYSECAQQVIATESSPGRGGAGRDQKLGSTNVGEQLCHKMPAVAYQGIWGCLRNEESHARQHALPLGRKLDGLHFYSLLVYLLSFLIHIKQGREVGRTKPHALVLKQNRIWDPMIYPTVPNECCGQGDILFQVGKEDWKVFQNPL